MKAPLLLLAATLPALGQGPLTPSTTIDPRVTGPTAPLTGGGAPQAGMKTMHQVEPRTPLVSGAPGVTYNSLNGGFTITASGSYYLTANLAVISGNGITINAEGVTLDLNGFNISTTASPASGMGVSVGTYAGAYVTNGSITGTGIASSTSLTLSGTGFEYGVHVNGDNAHISRISVRSASLWGIYSGDSSANMVENCTVRECVRGIQASTTTNCSVSRISSTGIQASLVNMCFAISYVGDGIAGGTINNSEGRTLNTNVASSACGIRTTPFGGGIVTNSRGVTGANPPDGLSNSRSIQAGTAVACTAVGPSFVVNRYNMPSSP